MRIRILLFALIGWFSCYMAEAASTNPETGIYRLTSGRSSGKAMTINSNGELVVATKNTSDLKQVWLIVRSGSTYYLRNASSGLYVQTEKNLYTKFSTGSTKATFYIQENAAVSDYFNISTKSDFSGTSCLHEDAQGSVVCWSATTKSPASGSEWKLESATDVSLDQIKEQFNKATGSATIEAGKYYRIISPEYNRAMTETVISKAVGTTEPANDLTQYWVLEKSGSGYFIKNAYTGRYIQKQNGTLSTQYKTNTTTNGAFTISVNNNFPYELRYNIVDNGQIVLHTAATQSYNTVGWYTSNGTSNLASVWYFQEVNPTQDELDATQKDFQDIQTAQNKESSHRTLVTNFFEDYACTTLKSEYQSMDDDALRTAMAELPTIIQEAAVKIKNNAWEKWEKEFRVADYGAYSAPDYWASKLQMHAYGRQNNPTGIIADKNELVYIFVGSSLPSGATLKVETCSSTSVWGDYSKQLKRGLNILVAPADNSHLFILYTSRNGDDISRYANLNIHIEGGRVNGFFDCKKRTDQDWTQMKKDGLFTAPVIDVLGEYIHWHMSTDYVKNNVGTKITEVMAVWDSTACWELDLMGLLKSEKYPDVYEDIYPRKFNNLMECTTVTGDSYMYSTSYYTGYNESNTGSIIQYSKVTAGDGTLWGPAHEIGHSNQGAIRLVGTTEVSNNLFSNMVIFKTGKYTTRYWNIQEMQRWMDQKLSWPELYGKNSERETIGLMNRMFFNLYLYYHALGNHPTFYQEVFKRLRNSPLVQTAGGITYAKNDYLKFARICSEVAGEDLSEYFEYWGFFRPVIKFEINDYSTYYVTATQREINDAKTAIKACGKPNGNIIFVEDRVENEMGKDGKTKRTLESYSVANCENEMGQYTDFPKHLEASGHIYVVDAKGNVTVTALGKNAVGFKIYDKDHNLAYVSATRKFKLPSYLVEEGGYTIVAAQSDGTDVQLFNKKTDTYYTMNIYRGTKNAIVRYTDAKAESGTIPTLNGNDLAFITEENAPDTLTTMRNVVAAGNTADSILLDNTLPYYAPQDFTAKTLKFNLAYGSHNNLLALPFAISQSDLASDLKLKAFKGVDEYNGNKYLLFEDTDDKIEAGVPFFLLNTSGQAGTQTLTCSDATVLANAGNINIGAQTLYGNFTASTVASGKYLPDSTCTTFSLVAENTECPAFGVWMESTDTDKAATYVIAYNDPTAIKEIATDKSQNKTMYDLQGRSVKQPGKGIYIINGKKVVIR